MNDANSFMKNKEKVHVRNAKLCNISLKLEKLSKEQLKMIELTVDSMINAFKEM